MKFRVFPSMPASSRCFSLAFYTKVGEEKKLGCKIDFPLNSSPHFQETFSSDEWKNWMRSENKVYPTIEALFQDENSTTL